MSNIAGRMKSRLRHPSNDVIDLDDIPVPLNIDNTHYNDDEPYLTPTREKGRYGRRNRLVATKHTGLQKQNDSKISKKDSDVSTKSIENQQHASANRTIHSAVRKPAKRDRKNRAPQPLTEPVLKHDDDVTLSEVEWKGRIWKPAKVTRSNIQGSAAGVAGDSTDGNRAEHTNSQENELLNSSDDVIVYDDILVAEDNEDLVLEDDGKKSIETETLNVNQIERNGSYSVERRLRELYKKPEYYLGRRYKTSKTKRKLENEPTTIDDTVVDTTTISIDEDLSFESANGSTEYKKSESPEKSQLSPSLAPKESKVRKSSTARSIRTRLFTRSESASRKTSLDSKELNSTLSKAKKFTSDGPKAGSLSPSLNSKTVDITRFSIDSKSLGKKVAEKLKVTDTTVSATNEQEPLENNDEGDKPVGIRDDEETDTFSNSITVD